MGSRSHDAYPVVALVSVSISKIRQYAESVVAAAIVNTETENPDARSVAVVRCASTESERTNVLTAISSLAPLRDARNTVANSPVCAV